MFEQTTTMLSNNYLTLLMNNRLSDNNLFTPNQQIFGQAVRLPGVIIFSPLEETGFPTIAEFYAFFENMLKQEDKR